MIVARIPGLYLYLLALCGKLLTFSASTSANDPEIRSNEVSSSIANIPPAVSICIKHPANLYVSNSFDRSIFAPHARHVNFAHGSHED